MKLRLFGIIATLSVVMSIGAFAQVGNALRVHIPFDFIAGGQKMAAGDYIVDESGEAGALVVRCLATRQSAIVLSAPASARTPEGNPGLTFERHNGNVYLSRVLAFGSAPRAIAVRLP